jgi:hypothetical protein
VTASIPLRVGRYVIRERVGVGAFGTVYRAYDPQLDREVALKVPHPGTLDDPKRVERFLGEARAAARLHHPHIVPVHDAGCDGTTHFIVAAFIERRTLAHALDQGPLDHRRAAELVRQLAEALAYAHRAGVVHRDVKPANVLLDPDGNAHLADFGLASRLDAGGTLTQTGSLLGTPTYMAPELASGSQREPSPAGDQYSLGVVLYELLCGEPPFTGPGPIALYQVVHQELQPPRRRNPRVPAELERICLKALAKDQGRRFASCQDLADALARWLTAPEPPVRPEPTRKPPTVPPAAVTVVMARRPVPEKTVLAPPRPAARRRRRPRLVLWPWVLAGSIVVMAAVLAAYLVEEVRQATLRAPAPAPARVTDSRPKWLTPPPVEKEVPAPGPEPMPAPPKELFRLLGDHGNLVAMNTEEPGGWQVYDWRGRRTLHRFPGPGGPLSCFAATPDGRLAVTSGPDRLVHVWDVAAGTETATLRDLGAPAVAAALSPAGDNVIAYDGDRKGLLWHLPQQVLRATYGFPDVRAIAFASDGNHLALAFESGNSIWFQNLANPEEQKPSNLKPIAPLSALAFSPGGGRLVAGMSDRSVRLRDLRTGNPVWEVHGMPAVPRAVTFSPDGTRVLVEMGPEAQVLDSQFGRVVRTVRAGPGGLLACGFGKSGQEVFALELPGGRVGRDVKPPDSAAPGR